MRRFLSLLLFACLALPLCAAVAAAAQQNAAPCPDDAPEPALTDAEKEELLLQFFGKAPGEAKPAPAPAPPRGWVGLTISPAKAGDLAAAGCKAPEGVLVEGVEEGAPGDTAGLEPGDVLVLPGGGPLTPQALAAQAQATAPGRTFVLERWRKGKARTVTLAPAKPPLGVRRKPGQGLAGLAAGIGFTGESRTAAERLSALLKAKGLAVRMVRYAATPESIATRHAGRLFVAQGFEAEGEQAAALAKPVQAFVAEPALGDLDAGPHFTFWPTR